MRSENKKEAKYILQLQNRPLKLGYFYLTIKVHKLTPDKPLTGRPICASINTITYHYSKWLNEKLAKSFITQSSDLILDIENKQLSANCCLLTADVDALYPSIIIEDGLSALNAVLLHFNSENRQLIVELAQWVLTNNFVAFSTRIFHQIRGTAMGTPFAVLMRTSI